MAQPMSFGRKCPLNDWEGDDLVPGSGGEYVTCADTATGRMAYWATNGRTDVDGKQIRAEIHPHDPNGVTMSQAAQGLHSLTGLNVVQIHWTTKQKLAWLRAGKGLIIPGHYWSVPRAYRQQAAASFNHMMFFPYINQSGLVRLYDPLNPATHEYGKFVHYSHLLPFINSLSWAVGYVPLQKP